MRPHAESAAQLVQRFATGVQQGVSCAAAAAAAAHGRRIAEWRVIERPASPASHSLLLAIRVTMCYLGG